ncbi:MAG: radical SAM protein [Candidatus Pacearchaeota archaeon]|nr:radical SAM protein [Candidatus Pacearchaeota archaeon]
MGVRRTKFASYCLGGIAEGCKYCVKGRKLVLFISGICSRACFYCSLSSKRKNVNKVWANERGCFSTRDMIEEARASKARGAGITGGDPLCRLERTLEYARTLKRTFGKKFHIHIYLPTKIVTRSKLKKLSRDVDEIRFHPNFLANKAEIIREEVAKVKLALGLWPKESIGIELPLLPDKFAETLRIIRATASFIGFVNLNEFEVSDTNLAYVTEHYKLNPDTYTIKGSKEMGLRIMKELKNLGLNVHLCTARTKNLFQYRNRLKLHEIMPYGFRTKEGSVRYFIIRPKNLAMAAKKLAEFEQFYIDKKNKRIIVSEKIVPEIIKLKKYKIAKVEELPTYDSTIISFEYL